MWRATEKRIPLPDHLIITADGSKISMQINVLEYLEHTVLRVPEKTAYANETTELTFQQVYHDSRSIGTFLIKNGHTKEPVVVFMKKHPHEIVAFFGAIYAGNFYVPIDEEMPKYRVERILENLHPKALICDEETKELVKNFSYSGNLYLYKEMTETPSDENLLTEVRKNAIDTDPIYIVFTSGSTGIPKGVAACHRSVIDYIERLSEVLELNENTIFGNQAPLYFDACLKEIFPTIKFGATTYLIPKHLFLFPVKLVEFLNQYRINTICWVVSALTMISGLGVLEKVKPEYLKTIAFGSEVFPIKQYNLWKQALPAASFTNLYGPTEATGMSCYYKVERAFSQEEVIPIGRPFANTRILLLDEKNHLAKQGEIGEICITGTALTLGYYNNFEQTEQVFVQNPLNHSYPERIYRTGDLGRYNEQGELMFISRKDYQIKHMGHRIELGEIEANVNLLEGILSSCCIYSEKKDKIVLYYVGDFDKGKMASALKERLPRYMIPNHIEQLEAMPLTPNGKLNRVYLKELYEESIAYS